MINFLADMGILQPWQRYVLSECCLMSFSGHESIAAIDQCCTAMTAIITVLCRLISYIEPLLNPLKGRCVIWLHLPIHV